MKGSAKKAAYKKTLVGWMPNDWTVERLKACANVIFSNVDKHIVAGEKEVYLCNYTDVYKNTYIFGGINFSKGTVKEAEFLKFRLKKGDVVITKDSEDRTDIAVPAFVIENIPDLVCGYHLAVIRPKSSILDGLFLYYALSSYNVNHYFQRRANGITRFGLDTETVRSSLIPLPSFKEQKNIATLLATWDKAIVTTSGLIAQKETRKKWLTQQLFSGKTRLKGHRDKWIYKPIKSFAKEVSIKNINNQELTVLSCTKYDGLVPSLEYFGRRIFANDLSSYKIVPQNHFAYATNHIEEGSIGYQSNLKEGLVSPMYTVFKTQIVNDNYLFRLLKSYAYIHEYQKRMEGSINRRGGLRWDEFSKIKIPIPSFEEQTAINNILQSADIEIQILRAEEQKFKEQKKGLMQVLLSGKVRVNKLTN